MLCRSCHCCPQCSNISSETAGPFKAKLHVEHPGGGGGGRKVCINGSGHMTRMAAMTINSKNLLWNQWTDFKET